MIYEANFDGCQVNSARFDTKRLVEIYNDDEVKAGPRAFNPIHLICLAIVEYGIILAINNDEERVASPPFVHSY